MGDTETTLERLIRRDRWWVAFGLAATIALGWIYLFREAAAMNAMAVEARMHALLVLAIYRGVALLDDDMSLRSAAVSGVVLLIVGIYQWLPFKNRCLTHCQSPLPFLTHWREGTGGALSMGARHGAFCVGCCWLLMVLLFVAGVMNLVWIAALSAFVLVEKVGPRGAAIGRVAGLIAASWGIYLVLK